MKSFDIRRTTVADLPALRQILDRIELFPSELLDDMIAPDLAGETEDLWLTCLADGHPVVATNYNPDTYHRLPPHLPLGEAFVWPNQAIDQLPADYSSNSQLFGEMVALQGVSPLDATVAMA